MTARKPIPLSVKAEVMRREGLEAHEPLIVFCAYCMRDGVAKWVRWPGEPIGQIELPRGFHWDHRMPVSRGGDNSPDNIAISCAECNLSKGSKLNWISPLERWCQENYPEILT